MQKIVFLLLFFFSGTASFSQQNFFVYLQADNHQPFYVKIDSKLYSSTESGYMIISRLGDSTYQFVIGFPKNAYPEQSFSVAINKKDKGFQLKNLGDKGWALVNSQNAAVIMNAGLRAKAVSEFSGIKKTDAFSEMLANVVNDSAILYTAVKEKIPEAVPEKKINPVSIDVEKKVPAKDSSATSTALVQQSIKEPVKSSGQPDSLSKPDSVVTRITTPPINQPAEKTNTANPLIAKPDSVLTQTTANRNEISATTNPANPAITKLDTTLTQTIISQTKPPLKTDSVKIGLTKPDTNKVAVQDPVKKINAEKPFITRIEEKKNEQGYQAIYIEQYNFSSDTIRIIIPLTETAAIPANATPDTTVTAKTPASVPDQKIVTEEKATPPKAVVIDTLSSAKRAIQITNSDCKEFATDYDVDKLRVKLINDNAIDDKLVTAKKYFKSKCFSVKQIRALTELFPSDETKYRFFDISYPFVSDTGNFYMLEELIEGNYYKNRFKAMITK